MGGEPDPITKRCIESHNIPGYEHRLITLDNCYHNQYIDEAIGATNLGVKRWCKVSDWLRLYYLFTEGGIYLDSDMEVLPGKNFDDLLDCPMFIGLDEDGNKASTALGAVAGHPALELIMNEVASNYRGSGGWIWETGFLYFTNKIAQLLPWNPLTKLLPSDYFFPYHWRDKTVNITENTRVFHHYLGSWVK